MRKWAISIFFFMIVLAASLVSIIFKPSFNFVYNHGESYLDEDAEINNTDVPYYDFEDPIQTEYDSDYDVIDNREYLTVERNVIIFVYANYNQGVEVISCDYSESYPNNRPTLVIPEEIDGRPVIKLGCAIVDNTLYDDPYGAYVSNCFSGLYVKEIKIPPKVKEIVSGTFDIETLEKIEVDKNNPYYSSKDGILYSKDGKVKLCVPEAHS